MINRPGFIDLFNLIKHLSWNGSKYRYFTENKKELELFEATEIKNKKKLLFVAQSIDKKKYDVLKIFHEGIELKF